MRHNLDHSEEMEVSFPQLVVATTPTAIGHPVCNYFYYEAPQHSHDDRRPICAITWVVVAVSGTWNFLDQKHDHRSTNL